MTMGTRIPSRRIGQSALAVLNPSPKCRTFSNLPLRHQRTLTTSTSHRAEKDISNPILEKYLEKQQREKASGRARRTPKIREGALSKNSLFDTSLETSIPKPLNASPEDLRKWKADVTAHEARETAEADLKLSALKLDPDPRGRKNWERKMVITSLRKRGRLTKAMKLKREERESHYKSPFLPTSIKKLTKLMNQIAGKTIEEALVQLRFSKKKVARDVWKGLKIARDEAIVGRGMGLGAEQEEPTEEELLRLQEQKEQKKLAKEAKKADEKKTSREAKTKASSSDEPHDLEAEKAKNGENLTTQLAAPVSAPAQPTKTEQLEVLMPDGMRRPTKNGKPTVIELKDGKSKRVYDATEMYVEQAWVGRGTPQRSPEYRARGKVNLLTHRTTCFSVVLKEEKTRMRISEEIKKKRSTRKLWVALPDRPVTAQRQYCLW